MNRLTVLVIVPIFVMLTGCARVATPSALIPPAVETQGSSGRIETPVSATSTPLPAPTETGLSEAISISVAQVTPIPCTGVLTSPNQEGPYYSAGSPERASLIEEGMPGTPILISGRVFDQACNPIAGASVDFWQADADGVYDNTGYRLRGHVVTDSTGNYQIETIVPGLYTGRPAHIHVKVFSPDGRELLTTQLYFPGSEGSADVLAAPDLLVQYQGSDGEGRQRVEFDFIVQN